MSLSKAVQDHLQVGRDLLLSLARFLSSGGGTTPNGKSTKKDQYNGESDHENLLNS
jgi:hypothetical protein